MARLPYRASAAAARDRSRAGSVRPGADFNGECALDRRGVEAEPPAGSLPDPDPPRSAGSGAPNPPSCRGRAAGLLRSDVARGGRGGRAPPPRAAARPPGAPRPPRPPGPGRGSREPLTAHALSALLSRRGASGFLTRVYGRETNPDTGAPRPPPRTHVRGAAGPAPGPDQPARLSSAVFPFGSVCAQTSPSVSSHGQRKSSGRITALRPSPLALLPSPLPRQALSPPRV